MIGVVRIGSINVDIDNGRVIGGLAFVRRIVIEVGMAERIWGVWLIFTWALPPKMNAFVFRCSEIII